MPVTNVTLAVPEANALSNAATIHALQLLVFALTQTHPDPKAVSDLYHQMWGDYLDGLGNLPPTAPHQLEALHAADHLVTRVLDEILAGALRE